MTENLPAAGWAGAESHQRLSTMAVLSLLLAVLAVAGCALPVLAGIVGSTPLAMASLALPGVGLAAGALGILALLAIGRSGGALTGRPLGIAGMLIGLLAAVLQGSAAFGAWRTASDIRTRLAPVAEALAERAASDPAGARALLGAGAEGDITEADLQGFASALDTELGAPVRAEMKLANLFESGAMLRRRYLEAGTNLPIPDAADARPVVFAGQRSRAVAYVFVDGEALERDEVLIEDVLVVLPETARAITLRDSGPASELAAALALEERH